MNCKTARRNAQLLAVLLCALPCAGISGNELHLDVGMGEGFRDPGYINYFRTDDQWHIGQPGYGQAEDYARQHNLRIFRLGYRSFDRSGAWLLGLEHIASDNKFHFGLFSGIYETRRHQVALAGREFKTQNEIHALELSAGGMNLASKTSRKNLSYSPGNAMIPRGAYLTNGGYAVRGSGPLMRIQYSYAPQLSDMRLFTGFDLASYAGDIRNEGGKSRWTWEEAGRHEGYYVHRTRNGLTGEFARIWAGVEFSDKEGPAAEIKLLAERNLSRPAGTEEFLFLDFYSSQGRQGRQLSPRFSSRHSLQEMIHDRWNYSQPTVGTSVSIQAAIKFRFALDQPGSLICLRPCKPLHRNQQGQGRKTYKDGSVYNGEWRGRQRSGTGTFHGVDGTIYRGEWKQDQPHGQGEMIWPNGKKYKGRWDQGKPAPEPAPDSNKPEKPE